MPIYVSVYHLDKIVVGRTDGQVTLADLEGYLDTIAKARAVGYRKIFDSTSGTSALPPRDLEIFRQRLKEFGEQHKGKVGPFAVVTGGERHNRLASVCQTAATADRPMRVFDDIHSARAWLDELAPVH